MIEWLKSILLSFKPIRFEDMSFEQITRSRAAMKHFGLDPDYKGLRFLDPKREKERGEAAFERIRPELEKLFKNN